MEYVLLESVDNYRLTVYPKLAVFRRYLYPNDQ